MNLRKLIKLINKVLVKRKILSTETIVSACAHTHAHTRTHTHTHTHMHARTHAHTHTHTYTPAPRPHKVQLEDTKTAATPADCLFADDTEVIL